MTTKYVKYCTPEKLSCGFVPDANVILCLQSADLVVQFDPPCGLPLTTILAQICAAGTISDSCQRPLYQYTFSYDDQQLVTPSVTLQQGDITGVICEDCLTDWIQQQISCVQSGITCVHDSDTITLTIGEDGCLTANLVGGGNTAWELLGNAGTVDGINFLGTTDNVPFSARVNNERFLRAQPGNGSPASAPDIIFGLSTNAINAASSGQGNTISGGGYPGTPNLIGTGINSVFQSVIGGGEDNSIDGDLTSDVTIAGGISNSVILGFGDFIGGGFQNLIDGTVASTAQNVIVGGEDNVIAATLSGSLPVENFIGGGVGHQLLDGDKGVIVGGDNNSLLFTTDCAIVGGLFNLISGVGAAATLDNIAEGCFIGGGGDHTDPTKGNTIEGDIGTVTSPRWSSIVGGSNNHILSGGNTCFIGGGLSNLLDGSGSTGNVIVGGYLHQITDSDYNFIGSGEGNFIKGTNSDGTSYSESNFIGGGFGNYIDCRPITPGDFYAYNVIAGGGGFIPAQSNSITAGIQCVIGGGNGNTLNGPLESASILGGDGNTVRASFSAILGGQNNLIDTAHTYSAILGGARLSLGSNSVGFNSSASPTTGTPDVDVSAISNIAIFNNVDTWIGNTNSTASKLKIFEPNASVTYTGTNFSSFEAQAQVADIQYILPATIGAANDVLTVDTTVGTVSTLKWAAGGGGGFITAISDTNSVDLTVTGSTLSADSKISADAGNQVSIHADGLFVPASAGSDASTGAITTTTSASYNATTGNYTILCDCTSNAITVNLPAVAGASTHILNIKKIDGSANTVTIDGNAAETIDGALTQVLLMQYSTIQIHCNGSAWYVI